MDMITAETTPDGMAVRLVALLVIGAISIVLGLTIRDGVTSFFRGFRLAALRSLGREAPPDWIVTDWLCAICRSVNVRAATRCARCKTPRAQAELRAAVPSAAPDVIPRLIDGAGRPVTLEHNRAAHRDSLDAHWRIRVNGSVIGSAAHREGALALLRAVGGTDVVLFDPRGSGLLTYHIADLIAAFEQPTSPLSEPCPEMAGSYARN